MFYEIVRIVMALAAGWFLGYLVGSVMALLLEGLFRLFKVRNLMTSILPSSLRVAGCVVGMLTAGRILLPQVFGS
jgi:hypothetical protein